MSQPVWVLSVDLQTKTATFQSGLADAAKSARGAFSEIKSGAGDMGRETSVNMMEARHGVMLLGEEFGIRLPRALSTFIASIGPVGAAMEAAFPFLAIIALATLLVEHLSRMREAGMKLTEDQVRFGTAVNNAWNSLDEKILQAQIRSDELSNNHFAALQHQLELIDKQSMDELVKSFEEVAKIADVVMKELDGHWYTFGKGSEGAKHALDEFQLKYEELKSKGDAAGMTGLLHGTAEQAQKVLGLLQQLQTSGRSNAFGSFADPAKFHEADDALTKMGIKHGEEVSKQIEAQQNLVSVLNAQIGSEERIATLKKLDSDNDKKAFGNAEQGRESAAARAEAESKARIGQAGLTAEKAAGEAALTIRRATLEEKLNFEIESAGKERDLQLATNAAEIAALDKSGKDYQNQLKALREKALEIEADYDAKVSEDKSKSSVAIAARDLQNLEEGERQKIEATRQGSGARLQAITAAIAQEESLNLQDTNFFRELLNMRVEVARQEAEEEGKLRQEAAKEAGDNSQKMGELALAAQKQQIALADSLRRVSIQQRVQEETQASDEEFRLKMVALSKEIDGLDKSGKDYENKLKSLQDKEKQLITEHENDITAIKEKAEEQRNTRILSAASSFENSIASGLTKSIMGHQTWSRMILSLGDQAVSGLIENSIKVMMQQDKERLGDARKAATSAYATGEKIGGPAGIILGPVFAAAAFAGVMAFEKGTDRVPGIGHGDIVPAMLSPGEGVVPGGVMDGLRTMVRDGGFNQRPSVTVHVRPTYHVNTIDGDGMQDALEKHTDQLQQHFENTLRKMNK